MLRIKKEGVLIVLILSVLLIFTAFLASATVEKAYSCLEGKVKGKCSSFATETKAFSLLALSYNYEIQQECKSTLLSSKDSANCWPKGSCNLKDTALAIIALSNLGENTNSSQQWLLSQGKKASGLEWYLEIDTIGESSCDIYFSGEDIYPITISADKKVSGSGTCISKAHPYGDYWFKIQESCLDKDFKVSCNKDFISTVLYKRQGSNIWYISNQVQSKVAGDKAEHSINFYCFGSPCDYESSLWVAYALKETGNSIEKYLPFLIALSDEDENSKYFPYAFLSVLGLDYNGEINIKKSIAGFWQVSDKGKYYDTASAILGLKSVPADTQDWLFKSQDTNGCWNSGNIRDTSFLLWAGWSKSSAEACEKAGGYCLSETECNATKGISLEKGCLGSNVCCSEQPLINKNCTDVGTVCNETNKKCTGTLSKTQDTDKCCVSGTCEYKDCELELKGSICSDITSCKGAVTNSAEGSCCLGTCEYKNCSEIGVACNETTSIPSVCNETEVITPDKSNCCLGTCTEKNCSQLNGIICNSTTFCNTTLINAVDTSECCQGSCVPACKPNSFCLNSPQECSIAAGSLLNNFCSEGVCCNKNYEPSKNCNEMPSQNGVSGIKCPAGSSCNGSLVGALDGICCFGSCFQETCEFFNGTICQSNEKCGGETANTTNTDKCCVSGTCTIETELEDCEENGFWCMSTGECQSGAKGKVLESFVCDRRKVCCDTELPSQERNCTQMGGKICRSGEDCSEVTLISSDTDECCKGTCEETTAEKTECEDEGNICRTECLDSEEEATFSCDSEKVCCKSKESEKSYWWVWLLIVLILLALVGIIFRDKLRAFLFNLKNKFSKGPTGVKRGPPFLPPPFASRVPQRMPLRRPMPATKTDRELEETLGKLREMSK